MKFILAYGRPFSPMSPWGVAGIFNERLQIDTLISYLQFQIPRENCGVGEDDPQSCPSGNLPADIQGDIDTAHGSWSMMEPTARTARRCLTSTAVRTAAQRHTPGWSWGDPGLPVKVHSVEFTGGKAASAFPNEADMISFIKNGSTMEPSNPVEVVACQDSVRC